MARLLTVLPIPSSSKIWKSCTTILVFNRRRKASSKKGVSPMKRVLGLAALAAVLACGTAQAQQINVKIGVLSDMSSLYADIGGPGSTAAAKVAIADFQKANPNVKVELVSGDHQNKPDIGSQIANQ